MHPCPLETCQCVASFDKIRGELTLWGTFQAPHVIRTVGSLLSNIPEHKIHVIAPDIGGGFGNKVGVYPGYVCSIVASIVTGRPVKWVEDRIENLSTTAFARDYHMDDGNRRDQGRQGDGPARAHPRRPRRVRCLRRRHQMAGRIVLNIITGSYDFPAAHVPGRRRLYQQGAGRRRLPLLVPRYRSGLCIERAMDIMAHKLGMDPAEFRIKNLIRREQFPYRRRSAGEYDSGDYHTAMHKAMDRSATRSCARNRRPSARRSGAARRAS